MYIPNNPKCIYEVHTHWGWFLLDEGAYRDYLADRLWITYVPGKSRRGEPVLPQLPNVTGEALRLRDLTAQRDAYSVCADYFPVGKVDIPYRERIRDVSISEMCLSVRSFNGLMRAGATTFGQLKEILERENGLRGIRNLGAKSEQEITLCFFNTCYSLLTEPEKAVWWQQVIDGNGDKRTPGTETA